MNCSKCGKEIVDPFCEKACKKKLCQECGVKCFETIRDSDEECKECCYEPEYDYEDPEDPLEPWTDPISGEVDYEQMEGDLGIDTGIDEGEGDY